MKKLSIHPGIMGMLLFMIPFISLSQWEMATGLDGGQVSGMVSVDSMLFAACEDKGIYSSSDNGIWEPAYWDISYDKVASAGSCVLIYGYSNYCKRSFDKGNTWETISNIYNTPIWSIDTVIFFNTNTGLKRSFDYGTSFDSISLPIQDQLTIVLCDDSLLYIHTWDGDYIHQIFYSNDNGDHWDSISTSGLFPVPYAEVEQLRFLKGTFWASTQTISAPYSHKGIFVYNDQIDQWFEVTNNLPSFFSYNDIIEDNNEVLCSYDSHPVFKFIVEDSSWVEYADGSKSVNQFLMHDDKLFCATDQGPCTLDTMGNWTTYYSGLQHRDISSICSYEGNIYVTANNELFYSEDGGNVFTRNDNAFGYQMITTDSVFYLISTDDFCMSWDQGNTWDSFTDGIEYPSYQRLTHFSITEKYYYLGTARGLYKSPSGSIFWTRLENGPFWAEFWVENVEAVDNTILTGASWPPHDLFFSNNYGYSFIDYGEYCEFRKIEQTYYLFKDSIFYSENEANTWIHLPHNYNHYLYSIDRIEDTIILGGRTIYGDPALQITYNMGGYWIDIIDNLPFNPYMFSGKIEQLKMIDGRIFAGNPKNGLWYRDDLIVSIPEKPKIIAFENIHVNVFPHPAKDELSIEITRNSKGPLTLSICTIHGKQVYYDQADAVSDTERLNISHLNTGLYLLTIINNGQRIVKKIVKL